MKKLSRCTWLSCLFCLALLLNAHGQKPAPVSLIFDSDIGPDYDDVGAMAVLHALADSGSVKILATIGSNQSRYLAPVMDVINTYFHRPNIPIGVVGGRAVNLAAWQSWDSLLVANYPHDTKSNAQAETALALYRRLLAAQADQSVTIVTVGFLTNLADLLLSKPDRYSALNGMALIKKKVKRLVCMAGRFPQGKEFNVDRDPVSSKIVFDTWPTVIVLSGWEIGQAIYTGLPLIQNQGIQNSPIKAAFVKAIPMAKEDAGGRMSWDQTAVLVAVKGHDPYYGVIEGRFVCAEDGSNRWDEQGRGHFYLVEKMAVDQVKDLLDRLMMHQPIKK